jgi:hypothetical protein
MTISTNHHGKFLATSIVGFARLHRANHSEAIQTKLESNAFFNIAAFFLVKLFFKRIIKTRVRVVEYRPARYQYLISP